MPDQVNTQSDKLVPPRQGAFLNLTVDATARAYDLTAVAIGSTYDASRSEDWVFVSLMNDGTVDIYYAFAAASGTAIDDTATIAVGVALAFANTYCAILKAGASVDWYIQRNVDKYLIVKTASGTSQLRFGASSSATPRSA